jgi:hypothetical protein
MKKEDKELLIKDLCPRLPYGLTIDFGGIRMTLHDMKVFHLYNGSDDIKDYICLINVFGDDDYVDVENIKPYLFPLSSMTEEQKEEFDRLYTYDALIVEPQWELIDWLNKNHFDYRGLIEKGLVIDATNQNVY